MNLAADEGIIEVAPKIKLDSEKKLARRRVVSDQELKALLDASPRYLQRVMIGLYETAMRREELVTLTWSRVDERPGLIRLLPEDTKEDDKRIIPIAPALADILTELRGCEKIEKTSASAIFASTKSNSCGCTFLQNPINSQTLRAEQRKLPSIANRSAARVFTRDGKPIASIRTAFELAKERAGVADVVLHDFRQTAITRWAEMGLPQEIVMKVSGHKSLAMHCRYVNFQEHHIKEAFKLFPSCFQEKATSQAKSVSG